MNIAFIPARGNSKTIKDKNLKKLGKITLLENSIIIAKQSNFFEKIVISSESDKILKIAKKYNVLTHKRKKYLSKDNSNVVDSAIDYLIKSKINTGILFLFQPTSPFVKKKHIKILLDKIAKSKYSSAQTITEVEHNNHSWNQRSISPTQEVSFLKKNRFKFYNKQLKPNYYVFGNLVAVNISKL